MKTKCLDRLQWFIEQSGIYHWKLNYDKNMNTNIFGVISDNKYFNGYDFIPVLHDGWEVTEVIAPQRCKINSKFESCMAKNYISSCEKCINYRESEK